MLELPPQEKTHIEPEGGWKEHTYYVIDVAFTKHNPIHRSILFVGFLNGKEGEPLSGGYTSVLTQESLGVRARDLHYIKVVSVIADMNREEG